MFRSLFEFSVDLGYGMLPIGVTGAVLAMVGAFINDIGYISLVLFNLDDTRTGRLALKISKFMWGAIAPLTCVGLLGMLCYICKILIDLGVM